MRILFVCHGNICRSTMAQYAFEHLLHEQGLSTEFSCDSAASSSEELGNPVHPGTRRILAQHDIACGSHLARRMTQADYRNFDLIVGMDSENLWGIRRIIGDDPQHKVHLLLDWSGNPRDIADPWYTGNFETTFDDVWEGCTSLLKHLTQEC